MWHVLQCTCCIVLNEHQDTCSKAAAVPSTFANTELVQAGDQEIRGPAKGSPTIPKAPWPHGRAAPHYVPGDAPPAAPVLGKAQINQHLVLPRQSLPQAVAGASQRLLMPHKIEDAGLADELGVTDSHAHSSSSAATFAAGSAVRSDGGLQLPPLQEATSPVAAGEVQHVPPSAARPHRYRGQLEQRVQELEQEARSAELRAIDVCSVIQPCV